MPPPPTPRPLPRAFYERPAEVVAPELLGKLLVRRVRGRTRAGRIVEVEAYTGVHDLACHAARGLTPRTRVLFGPPGRSYVYLIYGTSFLFNTSCQPDGVAAGVLVRALEPVEGELPATDGPGRLTAALGITLDDNDRDLCRGQRLWIEDRPDPARPPPGPADIVATPRINVDYAGAWAAAPLRFVDARSPWLSRKLPGSPRRPR